MGVNALLGRYDVGEASSVIDVRALACVEMSPVLSQQLMRSGSGSFTMQTYIRLKNEWWW